MNLDRRLGSLLCGLKCSMVFHSLIGEDRVNIGLLLMIIVLTQEINYSFYH